MEENLCYICYEKETKRRKFMPCRCACITLRIHCQCFKKLSNKQQCSICKKTYEKIEKNPMKEITRQWEDGMKEVFSINRKNKKSGWYKAYYPNGNLFIEAFYINGKRDGEFVVFHLDGTIRTFEIYCMGRKEKDMMKEEYESNINQQCGENLFLVFYNSDILFLYLFFIVRGYKLFV